MSTTGNDSVYNMEWQQLEKAAGTRLCFSGDVATIREQFACIPATLGLPFPPRDESIVSTKDEIVYPLGNLLAYPLRLRIYTPVKAEKGNLPIGVYFHGGGFIMGNFDVEDADCRYWAQEVPCVIVSVDYRLAPENGFGHILEDAEEALVWAYSNAASLGASREVLFTIGASAGACLALGAPKQILSKVMDVRIRGIVTLCPITAHASSLPENFRPIYNSYDTNAMNVPIISAATMEKFIGATKVKYDDARLFVSLGLEELVRNHGWPKTSIVTCDKDPLRDDGAVLETILKSAGKAGSVNRKNYEGLPHCFWSFLQKGMRNQLLNYVLEQIRWVLE